MTKASENEFPKVTLAESAAPGTPTAGLAYLYVSAEPKIYFVDDAGSETDITGGGDAIAETLIDAKGDIVVGTAANTAAVLPIGTNDYVLTADDTAALGMKWAEASGGIADEGEFTYLDSNGGTPAGTPAAGYARIYSRAGRFYSMDDEGTEYGPFDAAGEAGYAEPAYDIISTAAPMIGLPVATGSNSASAANRAYYIPLIVPQAMTAYRLFYVTGGTTSGDANVDMGIYDAAGTRLVSTGSTAWNKNNNNTTTTMDIVDTPLTAGLYYLGFVTSATSSVQFQRWNPQWCSAYGVLVEASALPLPGTASGGYIASEQFIPFAGIIGRSEIT